MNFGGNAPDRGLSWHFFRWRFASKTQKPQLRCQIAACRGTTSLCELMRYYHSLLTAAVIPVSVYCYGATSLCKLRRKCQSHSLLTVMALYASVNYRGDICLFELPRYYYYGGSGTVLHYLRWYCWHHLQRRKRLVKYKTCKHVLRVNTTN